ncbi:MAG: hypothetical protein RDU25_02165 [Patescibacteria group bacterium]|nr:hypothetical protein [Patescibacteria group bacterium]
MADTPNNDATTTEATLPAVLEAPKPEITATTASAKWQEKVGAFAKSIGKEYDAVTTELQKLVGDANDEGLEALADPECAGNDVIRGLFSGVPPVKLNKAIKDLRGAAAPKLVEPTTPKVAAPSAISMVGLLPEPPSDDTFLSALRVGGVAKVGATEVNAALRVLLAKQLGVYDLPDQLVALMEQHAETLEEPVSDAYYTLQRQVAERRYGEVLQAMGVPGHFMSEARKRKLLDRMGGLWALLDSFQQKLTGWQELWQTRMNNPAAMMAGFASMMSGGAAMMPGMMDHPDTAPVLDSASTVIENFNKMFAGTGIPVARALAHDTLRIKKVLEDPQLPAAIGAANRDEMLKKLGAGLTAEYVRLERDLVSYVLAVMKLAAGEVSTEQLPYYIIALQNRGINIPWDKLQAMKAAAPASPRKRNGGSDAEPERDFRSF